MSVYETFSVLYFLFIYFNEASQVTGNMEGFVSRVPIPMFDQVKIKLNIKIQKK
jgi:hypothetical protein